MGLHRMEIAKQELQKLPHIKVNPEDFGTRALPLSPLYDGEDWNIWYSQGGELQTLKGSPVKGEYWAQERVEDDDLYLRFLDFLNQHASWQDVLHDFNAIRNNILKLADAKAKGAFLASSGHVQGYKASDYVVIDLEWTLITCRSIFDHLQSIFGTIWGDKIELLDEDLEDVRRGASLPDSFASALLHDEEIKGAQLFREKYGFPPQIADFYLDRADFFLSLRTVRDNITHRGRGVEFILHKDGQFWLTDESRAIVGPLYDWEDRELSENGLAPLNPMWDHVLKGTVGALDDFAGLLEESFDFDRHVPAIAPDHQTFLRSPNTGLIGDILGQ